jgi:multiple sugar transport system substrate-binding protein
MKNRAGKRILSIAAAGTMLMGTLFGTTACGGQSRMDKDGNITLSFWSIYPEGDVNYEWTLSLISRFEEQNPNIKINYTGISFWDYFTKITTAMTDSSGPDIYLQTIKDTGDRARGGVSMDLSAYLDDEINKTCFYEQDLSPMEYNGGLYGLPYALDNRVLYYNIDIMNTLATTTDADWTGTKAGKKANTTITGRPADLIGTDGNVRAPQTYDELMAYTELLTLQENGKITQLGFDVNVGNCMFVNFVWSLGGDFFDENEKPVISTNEGVKAGFEAWYDVAKVNSTAKVNAFIDTAGDSSENLFWSKKVAMMISTNEIPWQNDKLSAANQINLGAASVPYNNVEENHYNFTGGFSLEMTTRLQKDDDKVVAAAAKFVKYLCSEDVQKEVLTESSNMPANINVYDDLFTEITDPAKVVVLKEMAYRKPYDYIYNAPNWWSEVQTALTDYVSGKRTLEETLANAQSAVERLQATNS